jgi:flagellar operon protein
MNGIPIDRFMAERVGPPQFQPAQPTIPPRSQQTDKPGFAEYLKSACEQVGCRTQFSGHAQARVTTRGIMLEPQQLARIDRAIDSVAGKGAQKALVMLDDLALIVGVEKRTVVTVVDQPSLQDSVFTQIDAAVIA